MRWKDLKIAKKLYIGFGIILILAIAVGYVGWSGLTDVSKAAGNSANADRLVKLVKEMAVERTAYVTDKDKKHYDVVSEKCEAMFGILDELKADLTSEADIASIAQIRQKANEYKAGWGQWVDITNQTLKAMADITADANIAQPEFFALRNELTEQLNGQISSKTDHSRLATTAQNAAFANKILGDYLDLRVAYRNYRLLDDKQYSEQFLDYADGIAAEADQAKSHFKDQASIDRINTIQKASRGLSASMKVVVSKTDESKQTMAQLSTLAKDLVMDIETLQQGQTKQMQSAQASAVTMAVSFVIGAVLLGVFIAFVIARGISKPVSQMAGVAEAISLGEVEHTIEVEARDEIGTLADAFRRLIDYMKDLAGAAESIASNDLTASVTPKSERDVLGTSFKTMIDNLTIMIRQLNDNAAELVSAANEIASSSEQMSRGAKDQAEQMIQVSTAVEEMSATIVESSKNAGEATDASRASADTATQGGQIVNDTIQGMQRIASVVRESADSIGKLAHSADQIGEIIGVIDDIADQTNLLALNAAIEAARAGEQGRGFAVVADEVRKLAERTGKATGEITEMIKGIQHETQEAVNSMESGIQEVDKGRELADRAGNSLTEIVNTSQRVMDMIQQIATAAEEQSTAAEQISKNVENVSSITKETAGGAEQSATAAEELNRQAEGLRQMVSRFRLRGAETADV